MGDLRSDIDNLLDKWNERSNFKIAGVSNLSRSDLDSILLYVDSWDGSRFRGLMRPLGAVATVLKAYGMEQKTTGFY